MRIKILLVVTLAAFSVSYGQGNNDNLTNAISDKGKNKLQNSILTLPINSEFEHETYHILQDSCILYGSNDWTCGDKDAFQYIPLPSKKDVQVILVPMNCGDFSYRFYLLTVKYNRIISNLYVEGEWFEPGNKQEDTIETTRFEISKNYIISVYTKHEGKEVKKQYKIDNSGTIKET